MDGTSRRSGQGKQLDGGLNKDAVVGESEYLEHEPGRRECKWKRVFLLYLFIHVDIPLENKRRTKAQSERFPL